MTMVEKGVRLHPRSYSVVISKANQVRRFLSPTYPKTTAHVESESNPRIPIGGQYMTVAARKAVRMVLSSTLLKVAILPCSP